MKEISVEYCNLPIKIALQNEHLAMQVEDLMHECKSISLDHLIHTGRTFRQVVCLDSEKLLPLEICQRIFEVMEKEDNRSPYPLSRMYPYLLHDSWTLDMKDVSYIKVDVHYRDEWSFCIRKIVKCYDQTEKKPFLCFYSYEPEIIKGIELQEMNGERFLKVMIQDEITLQRMMKSILLDGTLGLSNDHLF